MKWISRGFVLLLLIALLFVDSRLLDTALLSKKTLIDLLLLILFGALATRKPSFKLNNVSRLYLLLLGLYVLLIAFSSFYSRNPSDAIFTLFSDALYFLLFLGLVILFPNPADLVRNLKLPILLFTYLSLFLGIMQILQVSGNLNLTADSSYSVSSFFAHRNLFAHQLVFVFPFLLFYVFQQGVGRYFSTVALFLLLPMLVMLYCRSAWLAFIAGSAGVFITLFLLSSGKHRKVLLFAPIILVVIATISAYLFMDGKDLIHHLDSLMNWDYGSALKRRHLWSSTLDLIRDNPLFGYGAGEWKIEINRYIASLDLTESGRIFYQRPHNDFLWIWSESGIIPCLTFIALILLALRNSWRSAREGDRVAMISLYGLSAYIIIAIFSFPRERMEHHIFLVLFVLLSMPTGKVYRSIQSRSMFLIALIPLAIILSLDLIRYKGEMNLKEAHALRYKTELEAGLVKYELAMSPFYQVDGLSTPISFYSGLLQLRQDHREEALASFKMAKTVNPYHMQTLNNLGILYYGLSDRDSSIAQFEQVLQLDPDYNDARVNLAMVQASSEGFFNALETLRGIDISQLNADQTNKIVMILKARMRQLIAAETDPKRRASLERITISDAWLEDIFTKQIKERRTFEEQINLDVNYLINRESQL